MAPLSRRKRLISDKARLARARRQTVNRRKFFLDRLAAAPDQRQRVGAAADYWRAALRDAPAPVVEAAIKELLDLLDVAAEAAITEMEGAIR